MMKYFSYSELPTINDVAWFLFVHIYQSTIQAITRIICNA